MCVHVHVCACVMCKYWQLRKTEEQREREMMRNNKQKMLHVKVSVDESDIASVALAVLEVTNVLVDDQ